MLSITLRLAFSCSLPGSACTTLTLTLILMLTLTLILMLTLTLILTLTLPLSPTRRCRGMAAAPPRFLTLT